MFHTATMVLAALMAALVIAACTTQPAPSAGVAAPSDPALQGHAQWCNTLPASGYCLIDDRR